MDQYIYIYIGICIAVMYLLYSRKTERKNPYVIWVLSIPICIYIYRQYAVNSIAATTNQNIAVSVSSDVMTTPYPISSVSSFN